MKVKMVGEYTVIGGLKKDVYEAVDSRGYGVVIKAVKIRSPDKSVYRESEILKEVGIKGVPNTLGLIEAFDENGFHYVVLERIPGRDLDAELFENGRYDESTVVRFGLTMAGTLYSLHSGNPIIHRDVKPANLILTPFGEVVLIDYGIARRATDQDSIAGTDCFMPHEQRIAMSTPRSDVYALGATLYNLSTGKKPTPDNLDSIEQDDLSSQMIEIIKTATLPEPSRPSAKELKELMTKYRPNKTIFFVSRN